MAAGGSFENGTDILTVASTLLLGTGGKALLGIIFTLACLHHRCRVDDCLRTVFSRDLFPKLNYKTVILIVTIVGFILSNMGLNQILKVSVPFLVMGLSANDRPDCPDILQPSFQKSEESVYRSAMTFTGVFALMVWV